MGAFVGTISKIEDVGLTNLVFAHVKGFKSLVPRNSHYEGEPVIFIEPDSVLPDEPWAETYKKYAPKRVKPIKLAGYLTEGIILGFNDIPSDRLITHIQEGIIEEGMDVSFDLGVTKYEPPLPTEAGAVGGLPAWLPRTDEVRWEHLPLDAIVGSRLVTLKIDGSSCTYVIYRHDLDDMIIHVYSRSLEYADDGSTNYSRVLDKELECGILLREEIWDAAIDHFQENPTVEAVVFRGELYGNNIQKRGKNPHASMPLSWACFGNYEYDGHSLRRAPDYLHFCAESGADVIGEWMEVDEAFIQKVMNGEPLDFAPEMYEGVVIRFPAYTQKNATYTSCKVINKKYDALV
jgi:RNA ligase (TIGR02306 family)